MKRTRKTVTLGAKMLVIRKTEADKKWGNICSSLSLAPATVSTIMVNAGKIKQWAQKPQNCAHHIQVTLEILT